MGTIRAATVGALAVLLLALPARGHAACKIELLELPVKMVGSRAVATVGINGTPVPLTVDSGAFFSVLTEAAATQLDLRLRPLRGVQVEGITGGIDARLTTVDKLQLAKGDIAAVDFVVGTNEPGAGTMGLMGRNILSFTDTEYDLANGVIRFSFPNDDCAKANLAYWAGATHVSTLELESDYRRRSKTPSLRARIKLNGKEVVALFDTGATTLVTAQAARRAGVSEAQMTPSGAIYGAGRGSARSWTAPFEQVEIGDEAIAHNRLRVGDFALDDADLLLGIDFFLSHRIYVSKQQSKMFITYNGGTVFALNRVDGPGAQPESAQPSASGAAPSASSADAASADQLARRGAAFASRLDYESALVDLNRAIELEPTSAAHFTQRGAVLEALKRPESALLDFDKALELDPAQVEARWHRAVLRRRAGNRDGASFDLEALDKAIAPQAQLRLPMSALYLDLGQPAQALVQLNQWLAARPKEVRRDVALNARCWSRALLGVELDKALDDCNEAVDADKKNPAYLDSRGWVQFRLGRYGRALADFDRSLELRPGAAWTLYGRGLTKSRLGDVAQGESDLEAARKAQADIDLKVVRAGLMTEQSAKR
jgi:tetratricopeptide (TPR) repeat protein